MMKDFTTRSFENLLNALKSEGYLFFTVTDYLQEKNPLAQVILLRHDVELQYENALRFAVIQHRLGIKGTYYFRILEQSFDAAIIQKIVGLGHEIGYHYDDLSVCRGNYEKAVKRFEKNLNFLRKIAPIQTICMEGDPLSIYDNRDLWRKYDYHDFGIISEPYLDIDFNKVHYLTETGRRWDGDKFNVRDKVIKANYKKNNSDRSDLHKNIPQIDYNYHTTFDIISAVKRGNFPKQVMMTFHPQRWNDTMYQWAKELVLQQVKNIAKWGLLRVRKEKSNGK